MCFLNNYLDTGELKETQTIRYHREVTKFLRIGWKEVWKIIRITKYHYIWFFAEITRKGLAVQDNRDSVSAFIVIAVAHYRAWRLECCGVSRLITLWVASASFSRRFSSSFWSSILLIITYFPWLHTKNRNYYNRVNSWLLTPGPDCWNNFYFKPNLAKINFSLNLNVCLRFI